MTAPSPARVLRLACAALALAHAPALAQAALSAPARGGARASLGNDALSFRLALGDPSITPGGALGLGLDGDAEGAAISGYFSLGSLEEAGTGGATTAGIAAGPGSAAGAARLLFDPTSPASLSAGPPVELDTSLQSRTAVLGLRAGALSLFALAEGRGAVAMATKGRGAPRQTTAAATGLSCAWPMPGGLELRGLAALSCGGGPAPAASGWRPAPSASPALNPGDDGEARLGAALLARSARASGASLFAIVGSYGRLCGPGLALRLESREIAGPFSLRCAAGVAGTTFRQLAGPRQERLLDARAEARLAMRRASSLAATLEVEADGESLLYAPRWGTTGSLRLILPAGGRGGSFIDARLDAQKPAAGTSGGSCALAIVRKAGPDSGAAPGSSSTRLEGELCWDSKLAGLKLGLETDLAGEGGLPVLGLDLRIGLLGGGESGSPVLATGGAHILFPFGPGASLELRAWLPEQGAVLAPAGGGNQAAPPAFSLRWRAAFPAAPH